MASFRWAGTWAVPFSPGHVSQKLLAQLPRGGGTTVLCLVSVVWVEGSGPQGPLPSATGLGSGRGRSLPCSEPLVTSGHR